MKRTWIICLVLAAATAAVYLQVSHFDFVSFDDDVYVTDNAPVQHGLTPAGLLWAFRTGHGANWHPVTWISHMIDCQLFGLNAGAHHLVSALLHLINALLLFGVLRRMTGRLWPCAAVAFLFALHPLHVESVAWISERKDVLSTLFGLLSLWAYAAYAERGGRARYLLTATFLALGLMAKPMLVTFPFLFLLLDYWPLRRAGRARGEEAGPEMADPGPGGGPRFRRLSWAGLWAEKVPLFAIAAASAVATYLVQRSGGAVPGTDLVRMRLQIENAVVSYVWYIAKMIWPSGLSVLYPHPFLPGGRPLTPGQVAGAAMVLAAASGLVFRHLRRRPYLAVGWLWYLGTLVPVIGLVRVGYQAVADRYSYIPLIGLFILIAWGGAELLERLREHRAARAVGVGISVLALLLLGGAARTQTALWRDSETLYRHGLEVNPENPILHYNLGEVLQSRGEIDLAMEEYRATLRVKPDHAQAHNNLGNALARRGELEGAIHHFREAIALDPGFAKAQNNLGNALQAQGKLEEAAEAYRRALAIDPDYAIAHHNLAGTLDSLGRPEEAAAHYRSAIRIDPGYAKARCALGWLLDREGDGAEAITQFREAARLRPDWVEPYFGIASTLAARPHLSAEDRALGIDSAERAARLSGYRDLGVLETLADAYARDGRWEDAGQTAKLGLQLATSAGADAEAGKLRAMLDRYANRSR